MRQDYETLLLEWCDKLLELQVDKPEDTRVHGGIFCPACLGFHGRSWDAVYPLMYLADKTGNPKYLNAAMKLFDWGENFRCDDGSFYNGTHNGWAATTIFAGIALHDTLLYYDHLLDEKTRVKWQERLADCCAWTYQTINREFQTNINYFCASAALMALSADYFNNESYASRSDELADFCMQCFDADGLFCGEGKPIDGITKKGCRPVDIGYNVEESLGMLMIYAHQRKKPDITKQIRDSLLVHLEFMLPDGGWNNSFGTRNFKWTYWGSRTSAGCQQAYGTWEKEPVLSEAALRNLQLMKACTHDGLLYGGPDYQIHGEQPCVHHTFSHAVGLTTVLNEGDWMEQETAGYLRAALPAEIRQGTKYYKSLDTYQVRRGDFYATVTGYDFEYVKNGHASGGTLTCLWHPQAGPVIASSMTSYSMPEPHNMQLSLKKEQHASLTPRLEGTWKNKLYSQCCDYDPEIRLFETAQETTITVDASFCRLEYRITESELEITGTAAPALEHARFILPVIGKTTAGYSFEQGKLILPKERASLVIETTGLSEEPQPVFCLTAGFEAWNCIVNPDKNGKFRIKIYLTGRML